MFGSVSRFHGKCGGAGLISINISQQVLPILEGISVQNQNQDQADFILHLKKDQKCEMDVISG